MLYVPNIDQNLLSVGQLLQKGFKVLFEDNHCLIKDATRQDLFKVQMRGKSFSLDLFQEELTSQGFLKMQKSEMEDDPSIKGNQLLSDIYHRCNVAICEPVDHKEPADYKNPKSKKVMEEEVYVIEKNKTQELFNITQDRKVHQMDVKSTFLHGFLEEEIFVEQPKGFIMEGKEDKVYKLFKAIYGLKDVPRTWYNQIDDYLISLGFDKSLLESAPYVKSKGLNGEIKQSKDEKIADLFTKPLPSNKYEFSRQKIRICSSKKSRRSVGNSKR